MAFSNRRAAGRQLAELVAARMRILRENTGDESGERSRAARGGVVVLGLPRGGVPVAYEVAEALSAPLDVVVVRKLGVPSQPELAMGALAEGGVKVVDQRSVRAAGLDQADLDALVARELVELDGRAERLRRGRPRTDLAGRTVVIVDDGIATGATAVAACQVVRALGASTVVLAAPVGPAGQLGWLRPHADDVICLAQPESFFAVGQFYLDFSQTPDDEVVMLLDRAAARFETAGRPRDDGPPDDSPPDDSRPEAGPRQPTVGGELMGEQDEVEDEELVSKEVDVPLGTRRLRMTRTRATLPGHLTVPGDARGLVVFVHGSGSGRFSVRNRAVAEELHRAGLATFRFDLLTTAEKAFDDAGEFDVGRLARRLADVGDRLREVREVARLPVTYFGASTGAAVALWAAAEAGNGVGAGEGVVSVVSRGGRPDLAEARLGDVRAPTLFVVGSLDQAVLAANVQARSAMTAETKLAVVEGASHLFAEPGALAAVARLTRDWCLGHLPAAAGT